MYTLDSVKDGGTTIIEGGNEVVNENMNSGQKRGEVVTDVSIVKSSNSPVSSIAIAEGNSLNNLQYKIMKISTQKFLQSSGSRNLKFTE